MAEYGSMFVVSGLGAILFFGGWNGPIPIFGPELLNWAYAPDLDQESWYISGYLANLAGMINFISKAALGVIVMIWVRWTLPRLRIDQVITMCLKYCTPIAAAMFLGAMLWKFYDWPTLADNPLYQTNHQASKVREPWTRKVSKEIDNESNEISSHQKLSDSMDERK